MDHKARLPAGTRVFHISCIIGSMMPVRREEGWESRAPKCLQSPPGADLAASGLLLALLHLPLTRPLFLEATPHPHSFFHTLSCAWQSLCLEASMPSGPFERISWSFLSELPGLRALGRSLRSWRSAGGRVALSWLLECGARAGGTGDLLLGLVVPAAGKGQLV
uniref:Uncharacterized protein n=1 Tax=Mandrillus leucophaeus TaxID=9568 RepID=A0A2K5XBS9_MANLE